MNENNYDRSQISYRFALISDIHIDRENEGRNIYFKYAEENFSRALEVIKRRGCGFIISAGDQITNASGMTEEWQVYNSIISRSGYSGEIYAALGNHETRSAKYGINTLSDCIRDFISASKLSSKDILRPEGKPYYSFTEPRFGDAFIFMALENGADTNAIDNFSDEQMLWAENMLKEYTRQNRRVFLIQHANIYGFGAGDDTDDPAYAGAIRTSNEHGRAFRNNLRFKRLTERYPQMIWLSGHTHVTLEDNVNYTYPGGRACHMLHIPSLAGTARLSFDSGGRRALDRAFHRDTAQGYIADIYDDKAVFSGINFSLDRIYPEYTYTITNRK